MELFEQIRPDGATGQKLETYSGTFTTNGLNAGVEGINTYFAGRMLSEKGVFLAMDRLGSVRADSNGVTMAYFPWGEERGQGTPDNRTKFAGYYRDMPGQDYANARYYNGTSGSFWSPDPGGMKTADPRTPLSWNRYAYTTGDPINFLDPTGRTEQCAADTCVYVNASDWCTDDPYDASCDTGGGGTGYGSGPGAGDDQQGGGGGGGLVPKTPLGASYTTSQMQALDAGYNSAFQHLDDLPCASLFAVGADNAVSVAQSALLNTTYRFVQLPQGPGAGAQTTGSSDVQINTAGVFFHYTTNSNGTVTVNMPNRKGDQTSITFANAATLQGFILLHELGHEVGLFGPDTTAAINGNFSNAVLSDCFTQTNGVYK